ncbi:MAG: Gfo/Idh/MocA family oxidoreductase [Acidobacteria bacterium]|jgi:predicted dehydrogenase|nr:Gfo/Idh/MocA family oxidoreductase [Acidobacteriota bacterium]
MARIGAAVIGAGFMGGVHTEGLRRAGVEVVGALGVSAEETAGFVKAQGIPRGYASLDELLGDSAVQSVHIVTPNRLHHGMAKAALEAGKHVFCEKPLAMNSKETAELVALAGKRSKQAAAVNYNIRFYPLCLEARERVRGGEIGKIHHVAGSYVQDWLLLDTDYNWRVLAEEGGELRAVADIGTHWLDLVHAITGLEAEAVCADLMVVHPIRRRPKGEVETFTGKLGAEADTEPVKITTEDYGSILLRFKGGAKGTLWVSQVTAGRKNCLRYELAGEKAALEWISENPEVLWIGRRTGPNEVLMRDPSLLSPTARAAVGVPGGHAEGYADTFKQHFRAFYGYVEKGDFSATAPFATFKDGHREVVLCEAVLESHRNGGWVDVKGA